MFKGFKDIESLTKRLQHLPVDVKGTCKYLGVNLKPSNSINYKPSKSSDFHSSCTIESGVRTITYNPKNSVERFRFSIAHSLGHHFLNHFNYMNIFNCDSKCFSALSLGDDYFEKEANNFAVKLLTPKKFVDLLVFDGGIHSGARLCEHFKVSGRLMDFRLKQLGYI